MTPEPELEIIKSPAQARIVYASRVILRKQGKGYVTNCCFHSDKTPSLFVYEDNGSLIFKCQGCDATGNVLQFIQKLDNCSFKEATEKVKSILGWEEGRKYVNKVFQPVVSGREEKVEIPLQEIAVAEKALVSSQEAREWLAGRGLTLDTAQKFHLGYVQSAAAVNPNHPWVNDGWIIFPTINSRNVITCLKYRSVRGKKTEDGKPAFLRKSGMATGIFNAQTISPFDDVYVVEGEPDCMVMSQAGYASVALPGAGFTPTPEMRDMLLKSSTIYLAGDNDPVGRAAMEKLWAELRDRTYLLEWPEGCKDANDVFLKVCGGVAANLVDLVEDLSQKARSRPIPNFYDLKESLKIADRTNPMDDPRRLHFPWKSVDDMAVCRPGSVVSSFATFTGSGKTTFWTQVCLHEAIKHGAVVLNYSAELSPQEFSALVTTILTHQDRLTLTREDYEGAARILKETRFYIGYNPDISSIKQIIGDGKNETGLLEWAIRRFGATIVILDHLHFFTSGERDATNVEAEAMKRIKNLAVKYNLIFIVIGQSRKARPESRGKVSELSDAKGSESFTSTANTTYEIHRDVKKDIDFNNPPKDILDSNTAIRLYKARVKGPGNAAAMLFMNKVGVFCPTVPDGVL
jgi:twinkle protein